MVGVVLVSHSQKAAEGAAELALMMAPDAPVKAAGGLEDGSLGTSFEKISAAVEAADQGDGVALIMDMGSAVMTAEMVAESMDDRKISSWIAPLLKARSLSPLKRPVGRPLRPCRKKLNPAGIESCKPSR